MTSIETSLERIARDLDALVPAWALVGGLAVSARAEPRTTRDVDIAVACANDDEAEGLVYALQSKGYRVLATIEQKAMKRLATVRLAPPDDVDSGAVVDLLFASSGIEREIAGRAERLEILPGLSMRVATTADLVAMKVLARDDRRRPQDADDLRTLLARATSEDLAAARRALEEIDARGFGRGKRLLAALDRAVRSSAR